MAEHLPDELVLGYCQVIAERAKTSAGGGKNSLLIICFSNCGGMQGSTEAHFLASGGKVKTSGSIT